MNCAPTQCQARIASLLPDITTCCNWKDSKARNSRLCSGKHQSGSGLNLERRSVILCQLINQCPQVRVNGSKHSVVQIPQNCVRRTKFCSAMGIRSPEKSSPALFSVSVL